MPQHIAVIGATGATGQSFIEAMQRRDVKIRAISRRSDLGDLFPSGIDNRSAELEDVASLVSAISGTDAVHYIPPVFSAREELFGQNVIAAAEKAGVRRLVYHSVLQPFTPGLLHHVRKAKVEVHLRHSQLEWTILQSSMYTQTVLGFFDRNAGSLAPPFNLNRHFTPVYLGDVSEAAAIIHTTPGHSYAAYELCGPDRLDFVQMAGRLGEALGQHIIARQAERSDVAARVASVFHFSSEQMIDLEAMFDHYGEYGFTGSATVLGMILGREPTSFADAMRISFSKQ